jgi:hypothetical protein
MAHPSQELAMRLWMNRVTQAGVPPGGVVGVCIGAWKEARVYGRVDRWADGWTEEGHMTLGEKGGKGSREVTPQERRGAVAACTQFLSKDQAVTVFVSFPTLKNPRV